MRGWQSPVCAPVMTFLMSQLAAVTVWLTAGWTLTPPECLCACIHAPLAPSAPTDSQQSAAYPNPRLWLSQAQRQLAGPRPPPRPAPVLPLLCPRSLEGAELQWPPAGSLQCPTKGPAPPGPQSIAPCVLESRRVRGSGMCTTTKGMRWLGLARPEQDWGRHGLVESFTAQAPRTVGP